MIAASKTDQAQQPEQILVIGDTKDLVDRLIPLIDQSRDIRLVVRPRAELLESVATLVSDAVLTILALPVPHESDGAVIRRCRELIPHGQLAVITDYPYPQYGDVCLKAGADFYFNISLDLDEIGNLLGKSSEAEGNRNTKQPIGGRSAGHLAAR